MADNDKRNETGPLPPKLDLRKSGLLKATDRVPVPDEVKPEAPAAPTAAGPGTPQIKPSGQPVRSPAGTPIAPNAPEAAKVPAVPYAATPASPRPTPRGPQGTPGAVRLGQPPARPAAPGSGTPPAPRVMPTGPIPVSGGPKSAPTAKLVVPTDDSAGADGAKKKETTRIPLETARPRVQPAAGEASSATPSEGSGKTTRIPPVPKTRDTEETADAAKRKTSRISLDAVLGTEEGQGESGPKTIRLKRPGEGEGPKVSTQAKTITAKGPVPVSPVMAAAPAGQETSTQKRTVVVKRPSAASARKKLSVARASDAPAGQSPAAAGPAFQGGAAKPDSPHWLFGVIAIAATLVVLVTIYLFAAQAIGPNSSLTQYSVWRDGPNLGWPGKIVRTN